MFELAFDSGLLTFTQNGPQRAPLLRFPATSASDDTKALSNGKSQRTRGPGLAQPQTPRIQLFKKGKPRPDARIGNRQRRVDMHAERAAKSTIVARPGDKRVMAFAGICR